ncbi:MAG: DUF1559 domain-containing protein, partial [Planctomycetota bacterium]
KRAFPAGAESRENPDAPTAPHTFYRWSALAAVTPYLERSDELAQLDLTRPMYGVNFAVTPENVAGVAQVLPEFLCPSDSEAPVAEGFGPTNYAVCGGVGLGEPDNDFDNGSPLQTDGLFGVNSSVRPAEVTDGLSRTALASESPLGRPRDAEPHDPQREYKLVLLPVSDAQCAAPAPWNVTDARGFAWASGEYRCALYNHRYAPNAAEPDCLAAVIGGPPSVIFTAFGWRAARSLHPGGVNVLRVGGGLRFVTDGVAEPVWRALATVSGGEEESL